ncbi:hypothetical protein [Streptomyces sp. KHY 26]|uniref:hypothetical protein n=1 Tax=Streptomyces sp. KHY 26 TaxID=3097359 RepID=UPI00376F2CBA
MTESVARSSARTTSCGRPMTFGALCASLLPMAGSQRLPVRTASPSYWSQVLTACSSSYVHGPVHTSVASTSSKPNFHWQCRATQT